MKVFAKWIILTNILLLVLIPGCWDRRETEELLLVDAFAVDYIKDEKKFFVTLVSPKAQTMEGENMVSGGSGGSTGQQFRTSWTISSYGHSLEEAVSSLSTRSPRYIYTGHKRVILFGEEAAREVTSQSLDYFLRRIDTRLRNFLVLTKGKAAEIFKAQPEFEETITTEIYEILLKGSREDGYIPLIDLKKFAEYVLTPGQDPWAPVIEVFTPGETEKSKAGKTAIRINKTALFRNDRLVGILDATATKGFTILRGISTRGVLTTVSDKEVRTSLTYDGVKVKQIVTINENGIFVKYDLKMNGIINETNNYTSLADKDIKALEESFSQEAKKIISLAIEQIQEANSDVLGIGRSIHINYPQIWQKLKNDWYGIYPHIEITADVSINIQSTRLGFKPISAK